MDAISYIYSQHCQAALEPRVDQKVQPHPAFREIRRFHVFRVNHEDLAIQQGPEVQSLLEHLEYRAPHVVQRGLVDRGDLHLPIIT